MISVGIKLKKGRQFQKLGISKHFPNVTFVIVKTSSPSRHSQSHYQVIPFNLKNVYSMSTILETMLQTKNKE